MNFFFGLKLNDLHCSLTIPKFTNEGNLISQNTVYSSRIEKNFWVIKKQNCNEDDNFFYLNISVQEIENIFFLGHKDFCGEEEQKKIKKLDLSTSINSNFTFRANLKVYNIKNEFSSYQSEYPQEMIKNTGNVLTNVSSLLNNGQNNFLVFRQIYFLPVKKPFAVYLVDINLNKVLFKKKFYTNTTNIFNLSDVKDLKNCCFYSEGFLGIPIFISYGNSEGISMEHSHPPQLYILSKNKYKVISNLKDKVRKIVSGFH